MDVTFVTSNRHKVEEVRALLGTQGVRVRWSARALPEIQAETLEEVVREKIRAARGLRGTVLVEDSGLFIPALGGFPGVYSAPVLGMWGFGPLLELTRRRDPRATFRTVAAVRHSARVRLFTGEVRGRIARSPRGTGGFGYDPIFVPAGSRQTYAEWSPDRKRSESHRARAMNKVANYLVGRGTG